MTMPKISTYTVTAPAHWASALINGDYSGIDCETEFKRISDFEDSLYPDHITDDGEVDFISCPRLNSDTPDQLAGEYCEYTVLSRRD